MQNALEQQLRFLLETDKLKTIERHTVLTDKSRFENDAEHSWHFALMAMLLFDYAQPGVDLLRVLRMALIHDLVEIDAGDTFAYDEQGYQTKEARETAAADRLFGMLPEEQGAELRALWEEFDAMQTPDARYAAAIDRLQPFMNNVATDGYTWVDGNVREDQVRKRMEAVHDALPCVWPLADAHIRQAVEKGQLKPASKTE